MTHGYNFKRGVGFPEAHAPTGRPFGIFVTRNSGYGRRDRRVIKCWIIGRKMLLPASASLMKPLRWYGQRA